MTSRLNKDNPRDAVTTSADKTTTQPKKEAPGKREHRSPSPVEEARDDTDRKGAKERLRESEERFRIVFDEAPIGVALVDLDGRRFRANRYLCEMLGYSEQDLLEDYLEHVHPEDRQISTEHFQRALEGEVGTYELERRYLHADGHAVWNHTSVSLIRDSTGNPSYFICLHQDITERKRIEQKVTELSQRNELILNSAGEGILGCDNEGRITFVNPTAAKILGWEAEELLGQRGHPTMHHTKFDGTPYPREECPIHISIKDGISRGVTDEVFWRKDGTSFFTEYTCTPIERDEEIVGAVLTFSDVTERKQAEAALRESEEFFHALYEKVRHPIFLVDKELNVVDVNPYACKFYGYSQEEFKQMKISDLIIPEELASTQEKTEEIHQLGETFVPERRHRKKSGEIATVTFDVTSVTRAGQELYVSRITDITERKQAEERLKRSEASLAAAQQRAHLGSWEWNIATDELRWSDEHYRIFGHTPQSFTPAYETHYLNAIHPEDRERVERSINEAFEGRSYSFDYRIVRPDGKTRYVHSHGEVIFDEGGGEEPVGMAGTVQDITERKKAEERLHHQAFYDLLTELPNRQLFVDRLEQALRRTRRRSGRKKVAVLFMDLNNFKVINDSLGHGAGDLLLAMAGERLRSSLRPEDTLARFGGDEFTVLVEDVENPEDAVRVAKRIIEALREPFVVDARELFLKASIGIALGEARMQPSEDLIRDADIAMYRAKEEGSGYRMFEPVMYKRALRRLQMENELQRAIDSKEFVIHYQPIIDLRTEEVWGVEALVRWKHPERGLLDPEEFIPAAEESGLVSFMGEQVLKEACEQAIEWQERYPRIPPLVMAVNLSAQQLQRPDLASNIEAVLRETGLEAQCLSLDITETIYIKALEGHTVVLDELKRLGVHLSIDDFGVGYSSLSYLKRLPADSLKIDKSFIRGLSEDIEDTVIIQMIVDLAHTFGMEVVAEGVESSYQAEQLKEMGCDLAQGYYFTEPLPPQAASEFLAR